jgi:hypothetical protein
MHREQLGSAHINPREDLVQRLRAQPIWDGRVPPWHPQVGKSLASAPEPELVRERRHCVSRSFRAPPGAAEGVNGELAGRQLALELTAGSVHVHGLRCGRDRLHPPHRREHLGDVTLREPHAIEHARAGRPSRVRGLRPPAAHHGSLRSPAAALDRLRGRRTFTGTADLVTAAALIASEAHRCREEVGVPMTARSILIAAPLAIVALGLGATVALAECPPGPDDTELNVGYAFIATVDEASGDVGPPVPDNSPFDWHIEISTDRVYLGDVPDTLTFDGWSAGCYGIRGDQMKAGDRLLILSEHLDLSFLPRDPLYGDFLMWKRMDGQWDYYADALGENIEDVWITDAMRDASTTAAIVRLAKLNPPDTATALEPVDNVPWLLLIVAFLAGVGAASLRMRDRAAKR